MGSKRGWARVVRIVKETVMFLPSSSHSLDVLHWETLRLTPHHLTLTRHLPLKWAEWGWRVIW